jgi:hypothetical protein
MAIPKASHINLFSFNNLIIAEQFIHQNRTTTKQNKKGNKIKIKTIIFVLFHQLEMVRVKVASSNTLGAAK